MLEESHKPFIINATNIASSISNHSWLYPVLTRCHEPGQRPTRNRVLQTILEQMQTPPPFKLFEEERQATDYSASRQVLPNTLPPLVRPGFDLHNPPSIL
jgi:hypothetical protein